EGGMRVPCLAWWPGTVPAGSVTQELASTLDLFTTALKLAGARVPDDRVIDGLDLTPLLTGKGKSPRDTMFYYRGTRLYAVRQGPFKAPFVTRSAYGPAQPVEHDPPVLYHLGHDPSEQFDVAKDHPGVIADIRRAVATHQEGLKPGEPQLDKR